MAARSGCSPSCESLLLKLKKGQDILRKSIENLKPPLETVSATQRLLSKRKLDRHCRDSLTTKLDRVSDFPKKRARVLQLTPERESKPPSKHPRRLSSTPKKTPVDHHEAQSPDTSLEEALLERKKDNKENHLSETAFLPSPKLSRIVVDTGRRPTTHTSKVAVGSSLRKEGEQKKKKKKRGLTVSFVQSKEEAEKGPSPTCAGSPKRKFARHATHRNLDASVLDSLNASRHGAMDRHYSQTRKEGKFPRKYAGDDPRLGYDWIAGLLDASESYLSERDDEYFEEVKEFRRVNYAECHRRKDIVLPASPVKKDVTDDEDADEDIKTTCVSSYMLNDRLFPVPLCSLDHTRGNICPSCEDKSTRTYPPIKQYDIRMSVPHSVLQKPSQIRPHRRRSFDPTDSMGLANHCLIGWETAQPSTLPPQSTLDLKASLPKEDSLSRTKKTKESTRGQNLLDTSRLIEYNLLSRTAADI